MQTRAASIRFQAERKAGEFLGDVDLRTGFQKGTVPLSDLGLTKKESHRFQLLAKVPEYEKAELIAGLPVGMSGVTYQRPRKRGSSGGLYPPTRRGRLERNVGGRFRSHVPSRAGTPVFRARCAP